MRAIGFQAEPHRVKLNANQDVSFDFALQKAAARWSDLTMFQGGKLLPDGKGKQQLFANCSVCHSFQTRMATAVRDRAGWEDRVSYMRQAMQFALARRFNDQNAADMASYLANTFGLDSTLPKSPEDVTGYKETLRPISDEALNIIYVEYEMPGPNRMPWSAAPDKKGFLWMPFYGGVNKVGRLDPKTGEVKEFPLPVKETAGIHSAVPAPDGSIWFTEFALNKLGKNRSRHGSDH